MREGIQSQAAPAAVRGPAERLRAAPCWAGVVLLTAATLLAYLPAVRSGSFIWDDSFNITENQLLRTPEGLLHIWTRVGPAAGGTSQYYPLTYSSFWLEYQLWRLRPAGYHLVNVLLHAANAILVWRILRRLGVPGGYLAAAIFALHPAQVESVAWISERKNTLSGLFYLLSLLSYLRFADPRGPGTRASDPMREGGRRGGVSDRMRSPRWPLYLWSILLFLFSLASKSATVTLPAAILVILWWRNGRVEGRDVWLVLPLFVLGLGSSLLTSWVEKHQVGATGSRWFLTPVEHCLLAGRIAWFYLAKLIWPGNLIFTYPRWHVSQGAWPQYLYPLAALGALAALWLLRRRTGRGPLAAALYYAVTLAPALGFVDVYYMRFSYVADHFQYLACLGPVVLLCAAVARALGSGGGVGASRPA